MVVVQIDNELFEIPDGDLWFMKECTSCRSPEVIYLTLEELRIIYVPLYDARLPRSNVFVKLESSNTPVNLNVISEETFNKIMELEEKKKKEIARINNEIARISKFDVFVKEKGKFAKIVEDREVEYETVEHPKTGRVYYVGCDGGYYSIREIDNKDLKAKAHVVKKIVYEDGQEELIEEYTAEGCAEKYTYESNDGYGVRGHRGFTARTKNVIYKSEANYTMIPVREFVSKLCQEKQEIEKKVYEEIKKILIDELQRRGFRFSKEGGKVVIEFGKEKSEAIPTDEGLLAKGKYALLSKLFF